MDYSGFQTVLTKSKRKMAIVGVFILIVGLPFIIAVFASENKVLYWVFGLLFSLLGLFMIITSVRDLSKMKNGDLPILKAINQKEQDYLVWIYLKQINTKVEGIQAGTAQNLVLVTKNGKTQELVLGKKTPVSELVDYLSEQFPNAYVGYSDDNRSAVSQLLKKKV